MIKINSSGNIEVKNLDIAYFKIQVKNNKVNGPTVSVDLDPTEYLPHGNKSTGSFALDISTFALDKFNEILMPCGIKPMTLGDLRSPGGMITFAEKFPEITFISLDSTKEFNNQTLNNVTSSAMFYCTFLSNTEIEFDLDKKTKDIRLLKTLSVNASDFINMLYKVYLYTYSEQCRRELVASGLNRLAKNCKSRTYKSVSILVYDKYIDEMVQYATSDTFISRDIYPLSSSNRTTASGSGEIMSYFDRLLIEKIYNDTGIIEHNPNLFVMTTRNHHPSATGKNYGKIMCINGYKYVVGDCLISASLSAKYKTLDGGGEALTKMFNQPNFKHLMLTVAELINSTAVKLKHDDVVFDKDVDDMITNENVDFSIDYTSYTKSGGARRTEYADLSKRKITPVSRRDALYDICYNLMSVANINKTKAFGKLDVDFKRHYGYIKA